MSNLDVKYSMDRDKAYKEGDHMRWHMLTAIISIEKKVSETAQKLPKDLSNKFINELLNLIGVNRAGGKYDNK